MKKKKTEINIDIQESYFEQQDLKNLFLFIIPAWFTAYDNEK